jgi:hypothetical protein
MNRRTFERQQTDRVTSVLVFLMFIAFPIVAFAFSIVLPNL